MVHEITLTGYNAVYTGHNGKLVLGTAGSYGIEKLRLVYGVGWEGRTVSVIFTLGGATVKVLADSAGDVQVPPEATACSGMGSITILGADETSQRISVDVPYMVLTHADVHGESPDPTPDQWQQYVAIVKQYADQAQAAANKIPNPAPSDAGKSVIVQDDGSYGLALVQGGSGGTFDYNGLINKPQINGVSLTGNKTNEEINIKAITNKQIDSIIGQIERTLKL